MGTFRLGLSDLDFRTWTFGLGLSDLDVRTWTFGLGLSDLDFWTWTFGLGLSDLDFQTFRLGEYYGEPNINKKQFQIRKWTSHISAFAGFFTMRFQYTEPI